MKILREHFQSIHKLLQIINERTNNEAMFDCDSSYDGDHEFTLTESWEEAVKLFQYGYTDILDEIKTGMRENAKFQNTIAKRRMKPSVQGVVPHIPNALLGLPQSMINFESNIQKTKSVSLVYVETAAAIVEPEEFLQSGIALLSTIHALEIRGFRVNLKVMFFCGKCEDEYAFASVDVKHYREHLDLHKLCFPIAHPSMFRRIGFKWLETFPELKAVEWSDGYGEPIYDAELSGLKNLLRENEYFITLETTKECHYNVDEIIKQLNLK